MAASSSSPLARSSGTAGSAERLDRCKDWRKLRSAFPGPKAVLTRFGTDSVTSVAVPSRSTRAVYTKGKFVEWTSMQMQRLQDCLVGIEPAELAQIIRCVRQHPHVTVFTGEVRKPGALSSPEERVQRAFASFDQVAMTKRARGLPAEARETMIYWQLSRLITDSRAASSRDEHGRDQHDPQVHADRRPRPRPGRRQRVINIPIEYGVAEGNLP